MELMVKKLREAEIRPVNGEPNLVILSFPNLSMLVSRDLSRDFEAALKGNLKEPLGMIAEEAYQACAKEKPDSDVANSLIHAFSAAKVRLHPPSEQLELFEKVKEEKGFIDVIYDEAVDELIKDPKGFIEKMKEGIEIQRKGLHGPRIDRTGLLLYFGAWALLAYNIFGELSWGELDPLKWVVGAFLLLFTNKIIFKK